jgi:DNA-binding transcriptional regulator YhcF (GntR family)
MPLLKRGPIPKHHQLAEILRAMIRAGDLQPGDQVPTEDKLCARYGVSRGTVRQALDTLAREGLVSREAGRGTFVRADGTTTPHFTLGNFAEELRRQGIEPRTRLSGVVSCPLPRMSKNVCASNRARLSSTLNDYGWQTTNQFCTRRAIWLNAFAPNWCTTTWKTNLSTNS